MWKKRVSRLGEGRICRAESWGGSGVTSLGIKYGGQGRPGGEGEI